MLFFLLIHRYGTCIILFNLLRWKLGCTIFLVKMWTIGFIDCLLRPWHLVEEGRCCIAFLVNGVSSPMLKSSSFSQASTPIHAASMSVEMYALLIFFNALWFPQFREIMQHNTTFIVMPPPLLYLYQLYLIAHYPNIFHVLPREEHKLLFKRRYSEISTFNKVVRVSNAWHGDEWRQKSMYLLCVGV